MSTEVAPPPYRAADRLKQLVQEEQVAAGKVEGDRFINEMLEKRVTKLSFEGRMSLAANAYMKREGFEIKEVCMPAQQCNCHPKECEHYPRWHTTITTE